jgi:hypothetical protein
MTRDTRMIGATMFILLLAPSMLAGQSSSGTAPEPSQPRTSVVSVEQSSGKVGEPLETRVSVQFINSKTADVLQVLAKASGLTVELPQAPLLPVTITLTNVRLRVAFDAICDTASCTWRLEGTTVKVGSTARATPGGLPPSVSLALDQVVPSDVFRALGAALGIAVLIEGQVDRPPASVKFTNMDTQVALDLLCKSAGCTWQFDEGARELRVRFTAR